MKIAYASNSLGSFVWGAPFLSQGEFFHSMNTSLGGCRDFRSLLQIRRLVQECAFQERVVFKALKRITQVEDNSFYPNIRERIRLFEVLEGAEVENRAICEEGQKFLRELVERNYISSSSFRRPFIHKENEKPPRQKCGSLEMIQKSVVIAIERGGYIYSVLKEVLEEGEELAQVDRTRVIFLAEKVKNDLFFITSLREELMSAEDTSINWAALEETQEKINSIYWDLYFRGRSYQFISLHKEEEFQMVVDNLKVFRTVESECFTS